MSGAWAIHVRGVVQGVGFRPFVFRLAHAHALTGWVSNSEAGVEIFLEGTDHGLDAFVRGLKSSAPPAARVTDVDVRPSPPVGLGDFTICESRRRDVPSARISPDLPVCEDCLRELFDPADPRYRYPYINCTNCGPRYSVILALPYDRAQTTMAAWRLDDRCRRQYHDPADRRFHAQPLACPSCGPQYALRSVNETIGGSAEAIVESAARLRAGLILAVKGIGGYHLACDARNVSAVAALRHRKFRKEKPFALMAKDLEIARALVSLSAESEAMLTSAARPIVLAPALAMLPDVAPGNHDLGVMLPHTPLHYLLFDAGAPDALVMTSANRSTEPLAYDDDDARAQLSEIADAFLVGERPIARRVDDSVVRVGAFGPTILRRARGYAPGVVAVLPSARPILALGADLKNTITLTVDGLAMVSQHLGDLGHYRSFVAFQETVADLLSMYQVRRDDLLVVHDRHPQYRSTSYASSVDCAERVEIQHHRAHIASAVAEQGEWHRRVVGVSFDGTGYGDDGAIWGGEVFLGSVAEGFERVAHLRPAALPGGDAAAHSPVQAAAGFLHQIEGFPDVTAAPFHFPNRYRAAATLVEKGVRSFVTTSVGRLFDTAAALLGFTRDVTFEGQAAMWLEQLARSASAADAYPFPVMDGELDFRPLLESLARDRVRGRSPAKSARAFQRGVARGVADVAVGLCRQHGADTVVLSGGVFQNELLLQDLKGLLDRAPLQVWTNHVVPSNDGGISLGQAALAALGRSPAA